MIEQKKILAVIPARQNSKGLPGKNIADLAGKPLLAWTVEAAKRAELIDEVIVSTDGVEIADVAKKYGASIPFMRPAELAADDTAGVMPILHACEQLPNFDVVVVLQPTSPLRTAVHIDEAIRQFFQRRADFCVSVTTPKHHPNWLLKANESGFLDRYEDQPTAAHRQSLPELYALNGAIYVAKVKSLIRHQSLFGDKTTPYYMPPECSFDIDTKLDLQICDMMLQHQRK